MQQTLIRNVQLDGKTVNILIKDGVFADLDAPENTAADTVVDGSGKAIVPSFFNTHTHAAMTLCRGYADDLELFTWLNQHIWPLEAKLTEEDIYNGSRLAILEMIKSGTTFFTDMYWETHRTVQAAEEMGIRAALGLSVMDRMGKEKIESTLSVLDTWKDPSNGRIQLTVAPHAIYTCGTELLQLCTETAKKHNVRVTTHLAETEQEVTDCVAKHGCTPVQYLDKIGFLHDKLTVAHCIYVNDEDIEILRDRGVVLSHNPSSNMKLSSGIYRSQELIKAGCRLTLGTDGCASNNNLDMREEMKFAALLAKVRYNSETLPAGEVLKWATVNGADAFGMNAGKIEVGALGDCILLDLSNERLVPCYNLTSNWVYSADSRAIDTVICNGKPLMVGGKVEGEEEIIAKARETARRITGRDFC